MIYLLNERILKLPDFHRWMKKNKITDNVIYDAVEEMRNGLIDAELGGYVVKKRIPIPGRGKRGGARTLLATNKYNRWIFLFGFQKNAKDKISAKDLEALRELSLDLLGFSD